MITTEFSVDTPEFAPSISAGMIPPSLPRTPGFVTGGRLVRDRQVGRALDLCVSAYQSRLEITAHSHLWRTSEGFECRTSGMPVMLEWSKGKLHASLYPMEPIVADPTYVTTSIHHDDRLEIYRQCPTERYLWQNSEGFRHTECSLFEDKHDDAARLPICVSIGERTTVIEVAGFGRALRFVNTGSALLVGVYSGDAILRMRRYQEFLGPVPKLRAES